MARVLICGVMSVATGLVCVPVRYIAKTPRDDPQEGKYDEGCERKSPVGHKKWCELLSGSNGKQLHFISIRLAQQR